MVFSIIIGVDMLSQLVSGFLNRKDFPKQLTISILVTGFYTLIICLLRIIFSINIIYFDAVGIGLELYLMILFIKQLKLVKKEKVTWLVKTIGTIPVIAYFIYMLLIIIL